MDKTRKLFGKKLTGQVTGITSTLSALGPWGLAAVVAYLAGQGLVELVHKIQEWQSQPGAPPPALSLEEEARCAEAVREALYNWQSKPFKKRERLKNEGLFGPGQYRWWKETPGPPKPPKGPKDLYKWLAALEASAAKVVQQADKVGPEAKELLRELWRIIDGVKSVVVSYPYNGKINTIRFLYGYLDKTRNLWKVSKPGTTVPSIQREWLEGLGNYIKMLIKNVEKL